MEREIKKVLNTIEKNGYEAYIVGGYVRDLFLNTNSYDIDICTNALPKELLTLFPSGNVGIYGAIDFKIGKYSFEITTYRKEYNYQKRHPNKIEYINNLLEDLSRRDFTINTLCMNSRGNIVDILKGEEDLNRRVIAAVGDASSKIKEDPLRILRAIRFATILDFSIDQGVDKAIRDNVELVSTLSDFRIIDELTKILISDNYLKGISLLNKYDIFNILGISYTNLIKTHDINGMWAQLSFKKELAFNKETKHNINTIKKILNVGTINERVLFDYGLYYSIIAGEILGIDKQIVNDIYKKMPIKTSKDLAIKPEKIVKLFCLDTSNIKELLNDLISQILSGNVKNHPKNIYKYLQRYKEEKQ